jgi:hypothetical protein
MHSTHAYRKHKEAADSTQVFAIAAAGARADDDESGSDDMLHRLTGADVYGSDEEVIDSESSSDDESGPQHNASSGSASLSASSDKVVNNQAAKSVAGAQAQFRTLELRELRKFESLTAFGQNLSEIALDTAEWSPQRRPNKTDSKGHESPLIPTVDANKVRIVYCCIVALSCICIRAPFVRLRCAA